MEKNIFEINQEKLCANCFSHIDEKGVCRRCRTGVEIPDGLPGGTILHGKYIIGGTLYYDNSYFGYYGYDLEGNERVLIRELFPAGSYCRREGKNLSCDNRDNIMFLEFRNAVNHFHAEVKIMSGLEGANSVLGIKNLIDENGTSYSIIQFPENAILLSEYIRRRGGKLAYRDAMGIFEKMITALDSIHKAGAIHGNIRPENIILYEKRVLLTGMNYGGHFYLENRSSPLYTEMNRYAPLEQFTKSNKRGPWTDIYALGATVYYMLTGQFTVNVFSRIESLEESRQPSAIGSIPGVPAVLVNILEKMLEVRIDDRYRNLYELCRALRGAHLSRIRIKQYAKGSRKAGRGVRIGIIAGICGILVSGAAAAFLLYNPGESDPALSENAAETETNTENAAGEQDQTEEMPPEETMPAEEETAEETMPEEEIPDETPAAEGVPGEEAAEAPPEEENRSGEEEIGG